MKSFLIFVSLAVFLFSSAKATDYGVAVIYGGSADPTIVGYVYFMPLNATHVRVYANVSGITQNLGVPHGMHVHMYGDISDPTVAAAGGHFQGAGSNIHGCPPDTTREEGDMGNWDVGTDGTIQQSKDLDILILQGDNSIIGRAVVLHNKTDDCVAVSSSGARLARGVIGAGNPSYISSAVGLTYTAPNTAFNTGATVTNGVCYLSPINGSSVTGTVYLSVDSTNRIQVTATVNGLPLNTAHGIHIHEFGDISTRDGMSVGGHYNPYARGHGVPPAADRHVGDLGSICAYDGAGVAFYSYLNVIDGYNATYNYIGRAVVIHGLPDTNTTTYGPRIAQCVIGAANTATTAPTSTVASALPTCGIPSTTATTTTTTTTTGTAATTTTAGTTTTASSTTTTTTGQVTVATTTTSRTSSASASVIGASILVVGVLAFLL